MLVALLIIGISLFLLLYWFRYTALLILRTRPTQEFAYKIATANNLSFVEVRQKLRGPLRSDNLCGLSQALERDYEALKYLLGHAANAQAGTYTAEQRLLMMNFRVTKLWFQALWRFRPNAAKVALLEMSGVLEYFADVMGHRCAALTAEAVRA